MVRHLIDLRNDLDITHHIVLPAFLEGMKPAIERVKAEAGA